MCDCSLINRICTLCSYIYILEVRWENALSEPGVVFSLTFPKLFNAFTEYEKPLNLELKICRILIWNC